MTDLYAGVEKAIADLRTYANGLEREARKLIGEMAKYERLNTQEALAFLREPWCILPKSRDEWWVVIPKWTGMTVGWLERATETYNIFTVNRYSLWMGGIPDELRETLQLPEPFKTAVVDGHLEAEQSVADRFGQHLSGRDEIGFKIKRGHEFDLMADLIEAGSLPFKPQPVDAADLQTPKTVPHQLRPHQVEGWNAFLKYGAVGIYWPFGQGKTVIGCWALAHIKGPKLVVVPTRTLVEQWQERIRAWVGWNSQTEIITYAGFDKVKDREFALTIFDECHRLPANTFSRLASIRTKYRMGLSATPHREDERTNYIFALTGWPVGVDWTKFIRDGLIKPPQVEVRIVKDWTRKMAATSEELRTLPKGRKAIVFCDSIDRGKSLASRLDCPHVYGATSNRLDVIRDAAVTVVSRVGDEGLSLPTLSKVIEVDFHGGSRRQEGQRVGRLLHADGKGEHLVLMTQDEYDAYERRFLALEEKGFRVSVVTE